MCAEKNLSISLHKLEQWGLGSVFGRIDIVTLNATVPRLGGHKKHHKQVHLHIRAIAQCYIASWRRSHCPAIASFFDRLA